MKEEIESGLSSVRPNFFTEYKYEFVMPSFGLVSVPSRSKKRFLYFDLSGFLKNSRYY